MHLEVSRALKKIWGTTTPLVVTPLFEMHYLNIKPKHRCSFHKHRHKHNVFFVLEGTLYVDSECHDVMETQTIGPREWFSVGPSCKHQFRTGGDHCHALEMYYPESLSEDIVRYNVGAMVPGPYTRFDIGKKDS